MTAPAERKPPRPDELAQEFYRAALAAGGLCVQTCSSCGQTSHPPRMYCPRCSSGEWSFQPASGRGTVYSFTVSHYSVEPYWKERLPYTTIVVELEEGPRVVAAGQGWDEGVQLGAAVDVSVEALSEDFAFLWATPAGSADDE